MTNSRDHLRPNIVWICTDQQRYDTIGAWGNAFIRTPHIDSLVREGVSFRRAYAQSTVCTPSRSSFLTGRYPVTTRANQNGNAHFPADEVLVTKLLADAGYDCGLVGKLHLSSAQGRVEPRNDDGYRVFKWSHNPRPELERGNAYQDWLSEIGVDWKTAYRGRDGGIAAEHHQSTWCANEAVAFIKEQREPDTPWLLSVNFFDPHEPFDPPSSHRSLYDAGALPLPKWRAGELDHKPALQQHDYVHGGQDGIGPSCAMMSDPEKQQYIADYYAMITLIDDQVGRILKALDDTGQRENTLVLFMSDHGEMLGDHGLIMKGAYFYEELVHVPLIISWPAQLAAGVHEPGLVELVDIAPTLLELAGLSPHPRMQGKSLLPILDGSCSSIHHKHAVSCEYYGAMREHGDVMATMRFDGRYKIVVHHGMEPGELYDLQEDPDEFCNLWDEPSHRALLLELVLQCFESSVRAQDPYPPQIARY